MNNVVFSLILFTYQIGEVFVRATLDETNEMIEKAKDQTGDDITGLETSCEEHKQILKDLKVQLYAKFGNNINLEADED